MYLRLTKMAKKAKAELFNLTCVMNTDGHIELDYQAVDPEEFVKTMERGFPEYEGTVKVASLVRYLREIGDDVMANSSRYV